MRRAVSSARARRSPVADRLIARAITLVFSGTVALLLSVPSLAPAQTPVGNVESLPECLQQPVRQLQAVGVQTMVVIADRSQAGAVDSAGAIWRQRHPDLLVWSGPSGVHVMARWLSYAESRRLAQPYIGHEQACDLAQLVVEAGERRARTVWTLVLVGTTALLLMLLAAWRAPRVRAQNSK